jgi:anaerobic magnesium-protoporphyrin IX monomethyl ester cyclase
MTRVCLVYPDVGGIEHYGARKYYHGLGYLSSVLKQAGHETSLLYLQQEPTRDAFLADVAALDPAVVAFSATTHQFPYVARCAAWVKEAAPQRWTVVGGAHPTLVPEEVSATPGVDVVCVGEGEYPLRDMVNAVQEGRDFTSVANLWLRREGRLISNPMRPLIPSLDEIPFADRELFDFDQILANNDGWVDLMAGRGCPYGCSYCCNPGLRDRFKGLGKYVRFRSVDNVLTEIRSLAQRYAVKTLNFQDDVFTLDRDWTLRFCQAYSKEFALPFWINTRVERINDEEVVSALAHAGCRGVRIGIESGNENLRAEILKRRMSNDDIRRAFAMADKYGLDVYTCNMLGIPGETAAMIEETIALNRQLKPADLQFSVFYPYPMTELYDVCVREGYLQEGKSLPSYYERNSILCLPTLSQAELQREYDRFQQLKLELRMEKENPLRYRVYQVLLFLLGGDSAKARSALRRIGRLRLRLAGLWRRQAAQVKQ